MGGGGGLGQVFILDGGMTFTRVIVGFFTGGIERGIGRVISHSAGCGVLRDARSFVRVIVSRVLVVVVAVVI